MIRAFRGPARLPGAVEFPAIVERWTGFRIGQDHEQLLRGTMAVGTDSILYPHVAGFRLQMTLLTHPAFPLPIWNALQIRNSMVRHRPLERSTSYVLETVIGAHRLVEKGLEVDLHTSLSRGDDRDWESVVTYFYRGRFEEASARVAQPPSPDLSAAKAVASFRTPRSARWAFGSLTGDLNGIHMWDAYARRYGFAAAFMHPQRAIGLALSRMGLPNSERQSLRVWIKGPVLYDTDVVLLADEQARDHAFALSLNGDSRQAIAGVWSSSS
jgi:hypothetical protein